MNRSTRAKIANETLFILKKGWYEKNGKKITIKKDLESAAKHTILYSPPMVKETVSRGQRILIKSEKTTTLINVTEETTLHAAHRLVRDEGCENVLCLNFASAKNPGGGFLKGSQAQEESLARASGLYAAISQKSEYYIRNRECGSAFYTDYMMYSPSVPVFRDDADVLLHKPFLVSFLTIPAVNRGAVLRNEMEKIPLVESVMKNRIRNLLSVAVIHHHTHLVLGAWGCGVFKNDPADVASYFAYHFKRGEDLRNKIVAGKRGETMEGQFQSNFKKIVFAIVDHSKDKHTLQAFKQKFPD